jgi:putative flavoprotein involved in K+ transport
MDRERVSFDASVAANVAAGDAFAERARAMVDDIIRRHGLDAPPAEPEDTGAPVELNPPMALDLRAHEIASVVWCTGFTGDFSWLDPALLDVDGQPRHADADAAAAGVVRRAAPADPPHARFPGDAATVADAVKAQLGNRPLHCATTSRR